MNVAAVIPARMGSTRYPGKPLCNIEGFTMIEHVYRRTVMSDAVDETYVATPNEEIAEEVEPSTASTSWLGSIRGLPIGSQRRHVVQMPR